MEALHDDRGNEGGDVAAELEDALDEAGRDVGVLLRGLEEDGFEIGVEVAVHHGHLKLVLVVGDGADATDDCGGRLLAGKVDEEAVEGGDGDVAEAFCTVCEHLGPLFRGEEALAFRAVFKDGDDEGVEEPGAAGYNVEVTVVGRVEGAWIDGADGRHGYWPFSLACERVRIHPR